MKKKICLILIFAILFSFIVGSICFASENQLAFFYEGAYHFLPKDLTDNYNYFLLIKYDNQFYLYYSTFSFYKYSANSFQSNGQHFPADGIYYNVYNSLSDLNNSTTSTSCGWNARTPSNIDINNLLYVSSNFTLLDANGDKVQFSNSNSNIYSYSEELPEVYQNTGLNGVLSEVILLLPAVLVVIISFIGIRKGITFIRKILKKS